MPDSASVREADIIKAHPRMVRRWAEVYVGKLLLLGQDEAVAWGMAFFDKVDIPVIAEQAKLILKEKGLL